MLVSDILQSKGSAVIAIAPGESVAEAARLLTEKRIGALVVLDGERLAGILSERDIVRALARQGPGCLEGPLSALMTAKVVTCRPGHAIAEIMEMMTTSRIRHLPVVEKGKLAGMISIGDVVKWRVAEYEREQEALQDYIKTA